MNKKAIWLIIGLMTAAMIGIIWLQVNWIRFAVSLNEEDFDNKVFSAISRVSERLETEEQYEAYDLTQNGYSRAYIETEVRKKIEEGDLSLLFSFKDLGLGANELRISKKDLLDFALNDGDCTCAKCTSERQNKYASLINYYKDLPMVPIVERIGSLDRIESILHQELENRGITLPFKYGVFSNKKNSFVIANNHYVVEDDSPMVAQAGFKTLFNSKFVVNLFPQGDTSPGSLMIFFPNKSSFVWASVWSVLLGSVVLTGIIIICFAYVVLVIFNQKKLAEMKTDFINNMTHEFKTPIATISLASDSITNPAILNDPNKVKRFTEIIKLENQRMNNQVEKVLQMAVIEKQDFELKHIGLPLHEIIQRAAQNVSLPIEKKEGSVTLQLNAAQDLIKGDLTHISNIINNLLDNANKYTPLKPAILVSTSNVGKNIQIEISDNGIGMTKEDLKHIFEKFYRVHTGNLHDVKGFGLGLSYVKAMVHAHKGTIQVKSELGKGSTFTLSFPVSGEEE